MARPPEKSRSSTPRKDTRKDSHSDSRNESRNDSRSDSRKNTRTGNRTGQDAVKSSRYSEARSQSGFAAKERDTKSQNGKPHTTKLRHENDRSDSVYRDKPRGQKVETQKTFKSDAQPVDQAQSRGQREQRILRSRFRQAVSGLAQALERTGPADRKLEAYFRQHKQMGSKDRAFVADVVYGVLRHLRSLQFLLGDHADQPELLALLHLMRQAQWGPQTFADIECDLPFDELLPLVTTKQDLPAAVALDLPDWLFDRLSKDLSEQELPTLIAALNSNAPLDIRANRLKCDRNQLRQRLAVDGFELINVDSAPDALRKFSRAPLFNTEAFRDGWFEVQDVGSQLISLLVDAKPKQRIVDFCAGAGGKTLHLAAMMQNKGTVYAFDVAAKRLANLKQRLARAGVDNVRVQDIRDENDVHIKRQRNTMDAVLVDAPCSGSGTLRRNPDIKWRTLDMNALRDTQLRILKAAAALVKTGGRVVYATCSVLKDENESIVEAFLAEHPEFELKPVAPILAEQGIKLEGVDQYLRLWPHVHNTDGFFAAVLERRGADSE
jgi:16S rRNA (cytosine967-C5)-methyltransferase